VPIKKNLDQNVVTKWNTASAYALGYFTADGSMYTTNRHTHFIDFSSTDKELLVNIRKVFSSNHRISERKRTDIGKQLYRLQFGSKKLYADLEKLGFHQNKSKTLPLLSIPDTVFSHFVRGYFDGDGSVYFKQHIRKSSGKLRWVFSSRLTSGCKEFLIHLHKELKCKTPIQRGFIQHKTRGFELVFSHHDSLALYEFMYNNVSHDLRLSRKYLLFQKAVQTLYPVYKMRVRA